MTDNDARDITQIIVIEAYTRLKRVDPKNKLLEYLALNYASKARGGRIVFARGKQREFRQRFGAPGDVEALEKYVSELVHATIAAYGRLERDCLDST